MERNVEFARVRKSLKSKPQILINSCSVALIETVEPIRFGPMVQPVMLSPDPLNEGGVTATLAGFGRTMTEPRLDTKQYLESASMTIPECRRAFAKNPFNAVRVFEINICFKNIVGRSACGGDSGSSIVTEDGVSVGIVSWGDRVCGSGFPDVYARTSYYYDWIKNITEI